MKIFPQPKFRRGRPGPLPRRSCLPFPYDRHFACCAHNVIVFVLNGAVFSRRVFNVLVIYKRCVYILLSILVNKMF